MPVINPLSKDAAPKDAQPIFDELRQKFGRMPNIFAVMAHRPTSTAANTEPPRTPLRRSGWA